MDDRIKRMTKIDGKKFDFTTGVDNKYYDYYLNIFDVISCSEADENEKRIITLKEKIYNLNLVKERMLYITKK